MSVTPETRIKQQIIQLLKNLNIWNFPIMQGLGCYPGIPDRFACYKGRVFAIEVKSPKGKQSAAQERFQKAWEFHSKQPYILARSVDDVIVGLGLKDLFDG